MSQERLGVARPRRSCTVLVLVHNGPAPSRRTGPSMSARTPAAAHSYCTRPQTSRTPVRLLWKNPMSHLLHAFPRCDPASYLTGCIQTSIRLKAGAAYRSIQMRRQGSNFGQTVDATARPTPAARTQLILTRTTIASGPRSSLNELYERGHPSHLRSGAPARGARRSHN